LPRAGVSSVESQRCKEMAKEEEQHPSPTQLSDLLALAGGSRRQAVEQGIAGSSPLRTLDERERAAAKALQQAAGVRAPARLRVRVGSQRASTGTRVRWNRRYGALAGALAAAAAALALLLPGGAPGSPSVSQAAQLALRGPSGPAPVPDPGAPRGKLGERLQSLYFPNWSGTLGWRPVGVRSDRLGRRPAVTVYYERRGMSVAYTIIGAPVLAKPSAAVTHLGALTVQVLSLRGRNVVTWRRAGRTCVLSASTVPARVLERLARREPRRLTD
jgi:hypothetical protein